MKRPVLALLFAWAMNAICVHAQFVPQGIQYQAVLLDEQGLPLTNSRVVLRLSMFSDETQQRIHFAEMHQARTDDQGQVNLVIGEGKNLTGALADVPWADHPILLKVELEGKRAQHYQLLGETQLLSAPYAMHAHTAGQLSDGQAEREKNQSIYWLTGGNSKTVPATQFLGTRDNKDFIIKTNDSIRTTITSNGQYIIDAGATIDGEQDDINAYPLTISGSNQGIYIKVNEPRTGANNFLTFGDDQQFSWGRVEGQIFSELEQTWQYQLQVAGYALAAASLATRITAWSLQIAGDASAVCDLGAVPGNVAQVVAFVTELAGLLANSITWGDGIRREIGVYYATGAGDYAEWLERQEGERNLMFGEIAGVAGGKVSLNTDDADHFMVVSMRPAVLSNQPAAGQEHRFEKIAFMGQVPVRVVGPVAVGDYILPSGNNDGYGIAVHPKKMKSGDFARIVGVAWEASTGEHPFQFINTAVGINARELSHKADVLQRRVENIVAYLEGREPLYDAEVIAAAAAPTGRQQTQMLKIYSDEEMDQLLDRYEPFFKGLAVKVEQELKNQGYDVAAGPMAQFLKDPVPVLKDLRRNPAYYTQWALIDQQLPRKK